MLIQGQLRLGDVGAEGATLLDSFLFKEKTGRFVRRSVVREGMMRVRNECQFPVRIITVPEKNQVYRIAANTSFNFGAGLDNLSLGMQRGEERIVTPSGNPGTSEQNISAGGESDLNIGESGTFVTITDMYGMTLGVIDKHVCRKQTLLLKPLQQP